MTRIPSLGPRGEGWLGLQVVLMLAIPLAAWAASLSAVIETPAIAAARDIGAMLLIGGLSIVALSIAVLRRAQALSALPHPIDGASLVDSGPYRLVRHPIYSGLLLACFAVALIRVSWVVALLTLVLAVVLDLKRRREEAWLIERYPEYAAYRRRTKALVPFLY